MLYIFIQEVGFFGFERIYLAQPFLAAPFGTTYMYLQVAGAFGSFKSLYSECRIRRQCKIDQCQFVGVNASKFHSKII